VSSLFTFLALFLHAGMTQEDLSGHGGEARPYDPSDYTPEERRRIENLFRYILCACPRENWTRTLAGCPDGCADEQKMMVRLGVKAGKTDQEIIAEQVRIHRTEKVKAVPDSKLAHLTPYLVVGALAIALGAALVRSVRRRGPSAPRKALEAPPALSREDRELADTVERDLREMDE